MGSQIPVGNDRSRTYWTPIMERYFIDLMLEHMHKGNRTGHTFNRQAWTDILTTFNAKFASQYDKDVLKSRYTSMWKQFNDIKNLLGQTDFSWDETRQMVVADDYVWDEHIKAHPDSRPYQNKAVPNFNDLCLIYGYTTADGRYSRSSHDIDVDEDIQGMMSFGDGLAGLPAPNNERSKTEWTLAMDQYFIGLMLKLREKDHKVDNTFSKQAWDDILTLFNAKFGPQHSKRILRHRHKKLLKYYGDVTVLLKQDGFSWDESQQMVVAGDDVWDAYIKAHPQARPYRTRRLPNYEDMSLVFGDTFNNTTHSDSRLDLGNDITGMKTGGERSRTYWTPPMDRCLVDLLLEQVHKGNKIGQTFISQAWTDMVTSFNAKIKSQYDKDVLKNRYKHLRKQYNDVKILLDQDGFSWDETREIVTASDHVWDAYLEAHPEARTYRVKAVPSYYKLCIIYGYNGSEGRYRRLARDVDTESEVPLSVSREGQYNEAPTSTALVFEWTPTMDQCLIDLLLEHSRTENETNHMFSEEVWTHVILSFNEKLGLQYHKCALESRYIYLMKEYSDIRGLLNQSGFAWDEARQMVTADDVVWEAYAKEHPDSLAYRNKMIGYFGDLCMLFGSEMLDGGFNCQGLGIDMDYNILNIEMEEVSGDIQISLSDTDVPDQARKRLAPEPSSPSERFGKAQRTGEDTEELSTANNAGLVARVVSKQQGRNYIPLKNAMDVLQTIPEIDDDLLLDACDLFEDERKAKTFLALDANLRKKWLLRKLGR